MSELDVIRAALARLQPQWEQEKWFTNDPEPVKELTPDMPHHLGARVPGGTLAVKVTRGYRGFYTLLEFDTDGNLTDISAWE